MSCAHFKGAAHPVEVRLLLREGVAILPCNRGFESVIYRKTPKSLEKPPEMPQNMIEMRFLCGCVQNRDFG